MNVTNLKSNDLMMLVYDYQKKPAEYANLLVNQIYSTLYRLCDDKVKKEHNSNGSFSPSVHSIINEVYIRLKTAKYQKCIIESYKQFCYYIRKVVRSAFIDMTKYHQAQKRKKNSEGFGETKKNSTFDLIDFDNYLSELKKTDFLAAETLSLRYYNALSNEDIAIVLRSSVASIERYISRCKLKISLLSMERNG